MGGSLEPFVYLGATYPELSCFYDTWLICSFWRKYAWKLCLKVLHRLVNSRGQCIVGFRSYEWWSKERCQRQADMSLVIHGIQQLFYVIVTVEGFNQRPSLQGRASAFVVGVVNRVGLDIGTPPCTSGWWKTDSSMGTLQFPNQRYPKDEG